MIVQALIATGPPILHRTKAPPPPLLLSSPFKLCIHLHNLAAHIHVSVNMLTIFHSNPAIMKGMLTASYVGEVWSIRKLCQ